MATMTNPLSLPETIASAFGRGKSKKDIASVLTKSGIDAQQAQAMVDAAVRNYPSAVRAGAMKQVGWGIVLFLIGLVITAGTFSMAEGGGTGGFYIVSWGPMVYGAARVIRGLFRLATA